MAAAEELVDKIFSWVDQQKEIADKLDLRATELEQYNKNINVSKVVGSSLQVGGAAAATAAGIAAIITGGLALPFIATAGAVAAGAGLVTNVGSEVVSDVISRSTMDQAKKISENTEKLTEEIKEGMEILLEKRKRQDRDVSAEDYVVEQILRVIAKRNGVKVKAKDKVLTLLTKLSLEKILTTETDSNTKHSGLKVQLLSDFVTEVALKEFAKVGVPISQRPLLKAGAGKAAAALGMKVSFKAVKKVSGGAIGLLISVPELINNCMNLDNCETEASKLIRQQAKDIRKAAKIMKSELDEIEDVFRRQNDRKGNFSHCVLL